MPTSLRERHFVIAIIVSHDGATWLPETVASLTKQRHRIDQIIAVDTSSKDGSVKLLKGAGITVINADKNLGFGAAINTALTSSKLESAPEGATEWIWLIHDDCAPSANALGELLSAVDEKPNVAVAGPKLRGWHDRNHLLEVGVSIAGNGARWTGLEFREQDQGQHDGVREVLAVSTAGALIRREVFDELGGFDPELALFRDDVDFGWRVHTAGHSVICVPSAIAFHAEAAANERRSIDVQDNLFHRPLLLDRRHAAYVLMANSSLWLMPLIALQLASSAILRSVGFLLAKLPGYALDELAAVFLVLIKPQDLARARRNRRRTRLVSSRAVARFIPPRIEQLQLAIERARNVISNFWNKSALRQLTNNGGDSVLDFDDTTLEEADIELTPPLSPLRALARRPILTASIAVVFFSLVSFRGRIGDVVGGALPAVPASGLDLLREYVASWHLVGLGTSSNTPPWVALLGIASIITAFNLKLFVALLFLFAVPLAFLGAYRLARRFTNLHFLALLASLLYAFSPVTLTSVNSGRLGTVVLLIIGPWVFRTLLGFEKLESISWRGIWTLSIIIAVVLAFSPLIFLALAIWQLILFISDLFTFNNVNSNLTKEEFDRRNSRRFTILATPFLLSIPWSLEFVLHPSRILLDPGINLAGGSLFSIISGNPGGNGSLPIWLVSPLIFLAVTSLFVSKTGRLGEVALYFLALAALFGSREIAGHGTFEPQQLWVGSLIVIPTLAAMLSAVIIVDYYVPQISLANVDFRHILLALISALTAFSVLGSMFWWAATSSKAPLQRHSKSTLPAFLSVSAQTEERFKTLVLKYKGDQIKYFIARDRDLELGEPDVMNALSSDVTQAVDNLVSGRGITSSQVLAQFGIRYIFLARPYQEELTRTIDGAGGFTRVSSTAEGTSWKVTGALSHISFITNEGQYRTIPGGDIGAQGKLSSTGTIIVSEKFDDRWKMVLNGKLIRATETGNGLPKFSITEPGDFIIYHDGTARRGWVSLQFIIVATVIILALPARRRRSQMRAEELA
jgi:GT2 family glycosyltransferase